MTEDAPFLPGLSSVSGKPVHVAFDGGRLTSDAGVLILAEIERKLGVADRLARCIEDPRAPERVRHSLAEMIRFRALMIAAGYEDANDCDALRRDPAFKMAVGRLPETAAELCSQPTMSLAREPADRNRAEADDGGPLGGSTAVTVDGRSVLRRASPKSRAASCSTSTTPRIASMAASSCRCFIRANA